MSIHFADAFNQLIRERRLDRAILMDTLTQGFASAVRKKHGPNAEVKIEDDGHGSIELFLVKHVVDTVEDDSIQISVESAQDYAEGAEAGDVIEINVPFEEFGRNAIQITKQILMQKIREFERDRVFEEYKDRSGEIVSGSVQQIDRTGILVNLGNAEAFMPKKDQIRRERYQQGSSIRAVVMKVDKEAKGPMVTLSRTSPEFLKALFVQEVPEIYEGMIEIKSIAREAGGRSKIAVYSRDDRVDAVGACVGMKGSRVQAVVNELSGERIDIVPWSDDISTFISRALSPAKITQVRPDIEAHSVLVVVDEDQLSLAIGKEGQNVRLASRLTGWQIELVSNRELEQRQRLQEHLLMPIEEMVGVSEKMAEKLREAGINTVQKLIRTPGEKLLEIPGFGEKTVEKLLETAQGTVKELEAALEDLIKKENEERERAKKAEKPLFDESLLETPEPEPKEEKVKLTAATLFRDPAEVEAEAAAEAAAEPAQETTTEPVEEAAAADTPPAADEAPAAGETPDAPEDPEKKDAND
jgi:N utilization substance protein A